MNVLLGVLSEREMHVPRYGRVAARPTFRLVAAMNPFDAVGTARVTPALYDRSCRVAMGYQDEAAELQVVATTTGGRPPWSPGRSGPCGSPATTPSCGSAPPSAARSTRC